jgi:hypothetical protein
MISRLLLLFGALLLLGAAEPPSRPTPLSPADAAKQGRELVAEILSQSQRPAQNVTNTGVLKIRDDKGRRTEIPVKFEIIAGQTAWNAVYVTTGQGKGGVVLTVAHSDAKPNEYSLDEPGKVRSLAGNETMIPFAGSDFWAADLGLEFLHWPEQRLLKAEMRRSRSCHVLESVNPLPAPGAYSRVVSWIDVETDFIVHAEAYDFKNKLLKEFDPKEFKKVRGQWQLQEMEISNRQTGSRTRIEFELGGKQ